jgi:hypothetical protein
VPFLRRTFDPERLGGSLVNRSWLHPRVRLSAIESVGFTWSPDAGSLPRPEEDGRVYVHLVVEGRLHLLSTGEVLEPGSGIVTTSYRASFEDEGLAFVGGHRAVALRLDRRLVAAPQRGVVHVPLDVLRAIHRSIGRTSSEAGARGTTLALLALLEVEGLRVAADAEVQLGEESTEDDAALAARLSYALTVDSTLPAWIDLLSVGASGSERHVRRQLGAFLLRHGMPFASWRELRQSFCLTTAALAMSLPGARTDVVARAAGFSSATSLCHALHRAELDAPQQIATRAAALRRAL